MWSAAFGLCGIRRQRKTGFSQACSDLACDVPQPDCDRAPALRPVTDFFPAWDRPPVSAPAEPDVHRVSTSFAPIGRCTDATLSAATILDANHALKWRADDRPYKTRVRGNDMRSNDMPSLLITTPLSLRMRVVLRVRPRKRCVDSGTQQRLCAFLCDMRPDLRIVYRFSRREGRVKRRSAMSSSFGPPPAVRIFIASKKPIRINHFLNNSQSYPQACAYPL